MEKILLAIDAINPDINSFEFACYLGRLTKSKVTGIFLENLVAEERPVLSELHGVAYIGHEIDTSSAAYKARIEAIEKSIAFFKEACISRGINFSLHRNHGVPTQELIEESRFADVVVVDAETSFKNNYEDRPTEFVKDILKKAECPVIIAPERYEGIDEIVFTYNGTASAAYAIKQFTYLFPELYNEKVTIVQVNEKGEWKEKDKYNFTEWLNDHYTNMHFEALKGDVENKLFEYLFKRKNILLVMGAYGRNALSQFFKHSPADLLIKTVSQPIFITHL
jgi:nucleotide-binding universal stress UspA family protein